MPAAMPSGEALSSTATDSASRHRSAPAQASPEKGPAASLVTESSAARSLLEALPVAACILDSRGRVDAFNSSWGMLAANYEFLHPLASRHASFTEVCAKGSEEGLRDLGARVRHVLAYDGTLPHTHLSFEFAAGTGWFYARV